MLRRELQTWGGGAGNERKAADEGAVEQGEVGEGVVGEGVVGEGGVVAVLSPFVQEPMHRRWSALRGRGNRRAQKVERANIWPKVAALAALEAPGHLG